MPGRGSIAAEAIRERLMRRYYSAPIIENSFRGAYVEEMIAYVIEPDWRHCSAGWAGWDFENAGGSVRLQVKQSARRQTWPGPWSVGKYTIAAAKGYYEGNIWRQLPKPARLAQMYIFAFHPRDDDNADQRDPEQWEFRIVPAVELPARQKHIFVSAVCQLYPNVSLSDLKSELAKAATGI